MKKDKETKDGQAQEEPKEPEKKESPEEPEKGTAPEGGQLPDVGDLGIDEAMQLVTPLIEKAVTDTLSKMNLPQLITVAVDKKLAPMMKIAEEQLGKGAAAPADVSAPRLAAAAAAGAAGGEVQDQVVSLLLQKLLGGGGQGNNMSQLGEMLKSVNSIAEMAAAPYRAGRSEYAKEINQTLILLRNAGATPDKARDLLIDISGQEGKGA